MHLSPAETDRLLLFTAAELARRRLGRGLALNVPETIALIADTICEVARDGGRHSQAIEAGRQALRPDQVMAGVSDIVRHVAVEAVFDDGTRLVVVNQPLGSVSGRQDAPGAITSTLSADPGRFGNVTSMPPTPGPVVDVSHLTITNTAAVPVSITSHMHVFEVNPRLLLDRAAAWGRHLDIPAGSVLRLAPGESATVALIPIAGERVVIGGAGLVDGPLDAPGALERALELLRACGYLDSSAPEELGAPKLQEHPQGAAPDPDQAVAALLRVLRQAHS